MRRDFKQTKKDKEIQLTAVIPDSCWLRPISQLSQTVSRVTVSDDLPTAHFLHVVCSETSWYLPGIHDKQAVIPVSGCWRPIKQESHFFLRPTSVDDLPSAHSKQISFPLSLMNFPGVHGKLVVGWNRKEKKRRGE